MLGSTLRALQSLLDGQRVLAIAVAADAVPAAVTFGLGDFTLFRLDFMSRIYVAGFGSAIAVPPGDIARLAGPA